MWVFAAIPFDLTSISPPSPFKYSKQKDEIMQIKMLAGWGDRGWPLTLLCVKFALRLYLTNRVKNVICSV